MITLEQIREAIKAEVEKEGPDFVYESPDEIECVYRHKGVPSCLIGRALDRLIPGVQIPEGKTAFFALRELVTPAAATYADIAQRYQDRGYSWGDALNEAEETLETLG